MRRFISLAITVLVGGLLLSSCGDSGSGDGGFQVTSGVVSHEATKDMLVFAPDAEGSWPVIVAFHGVGGTPEDMAEIATRLAREGNVVFAPTYGTDITTQEGVDQAGVDAECGYRFARSIAAEYGGDLDQPLTFVGWSLGASAALAIGLTEEIDPTGEVRLVLRPGASPRHHRGHLRLPLRGRAARPRRHEVMGEQGGRHRPDRRGAGHHVPSMGDRGRCGGVALSGL